jgi:hypothetical protein
MTTEDRADFLVCYDYGMGGLWGILRARSAEEIHEKYPELDIAETRPGWMTEDYFRKISAPDRLMDIGAEPTSWLLKALIADRHHA